MPCRWPSILALLYSWPPEISRNVWINGEAMDTPAIFAKGLTKTFKTRKGSITAVDALSLQVGRGETYGLIGPDGAGQTTTVRVLLGLLTRTAGESSILGFDSMRSTYPIRDRTGYIAQSNVLPADLSV